MINFFKFYCFSLHKESCQQTCQEADDKSVTGRSVSRKLNLVLIGCPRQDLVSTVVGGIDKLSRCS